MYVKAETSNPNYASGAITNALLYQNPTTTNPIPAVVAKPSGTIASPSVVSNDSWGYAVAGIGGFNTTYTPNQATDLYAQMTTSDTQVYTTDQWPVPKDSFDFYYASQLSMVTPAGSYKTKVIYTAVGEEIPAAPVTCENSGKAPECIAFTVDAGTTGTYTIPTHGRVLPDVPKAYDWDIYVNGVLTTSCPGGRCTGYSSGGSYGLGLTDLPNGQNQILIVPNGSPAPGWGNAFGGGGSDGDKIISIDRPLTTMAFAPKITESTTSAENMFAGIFYGCSNLTNAATIIDTYKLPDTITDLSGFLEGAHYDNTNLQSPIDLSGLSGWFNNNTSITNLSYFLSYAHYSNPNLTSPIDLTPLSGWFSANTSIANLSNFLNDTHYNNTNLTLSGQTILPNWIKTIKEGSTSIWNVDGAFSSTFATSSNILSDTGEVKFMDGTVLSQIGTPTNNRRTYMRRPGIMPVNANWQ